MSRKSVEQLLDRWINDQTFREQLRADPEGTVRRSGAQLNEDEWAALRAVDWTQSDEDLQARNSKW